MAKANKKLGQHWLNHKPSLASIVEAGEIVADDTVLEIGPGLGSLTRLLVRRAKKVVAVEFDPALAEKLGAEVRAPNLEVHHEDILEFKLTDLPVGYKVVANIPYYLTSKLLRVLCESANPPAKMVLLVQKEVAERICAQPGQMSLLSVSVQLYYECHLGDIVPSELFEPPPKVDSQFVILEHRTKPAAGVKDHRQFFRVVKAGFASRRKKLRSSLAGGLRLDKKAADQLLARAGIDGNRRAQELSLAEWQAISQKLGE